MNRRSLLASLIGMAGSLLWPWKAMPYTIAEIADASHLDANLAEKPRRNIMALWRWNVERKRLEYIWSSSEESDWTDIVCFEPDP